MPYLSQMFYGYMKRYGKFGKAALNNWIINESQNGTEPEEILIRKIKRTRNNKTIQIIIHNVLLFFHLCYKGDSPMPNKGTHVAVALSKDKMQSGRKWRALIMNEDSNQMIIEITTPNDCLVTKWKFRIDITKKDHTGKPMILKSKKNGIVYTVCNPWHNGMGNV